MGCFWSQPQCWTGYRWNMGLYFCFSGPITSGFMKARPANIGAWIVVVFMSMCSRVSVLFGNIVLITSKIQVPVVLMPASCNIWGKWELWNCFWKLWRLNVSRICSMTIRNHPRNFLATNCPLTHFKNIFPNKDFGFINVLYTGKPSKFLFVCRGCDWGNTCSFSIKTWCFGRVFTTTPPLHLKLIREHLRLHKLSLPFVVCYSIINVCHSCWRRVEILHAPWLLGNWEIQTQILGM